MDLKGSLTDTNLRIYPTKHLLEFLSSVTSEDCPPVNILKLLNRKISDKVQSKETIIKPVQLSNEDIKNLNKIKELVKFDSDEVNEVEPENDDKDEKVKKTKDSKEVSKETREKSNDDSSSSKDKNNCKALLEHKNKDEKEINEDFLTTSDIDWLYNYVQEKRKNGKDKVPFLHELLNGAQVEMPDNTVIKRNPVLEARCVKLRAQQEAREYRKMTKGVDNVRMRFPEDSINYQLKQVNRQLIAIGQFIISIFAGFLFGFRGVEWMVGNLDFGFRLLLGVMCALVIALAEIYFLAKKLNEELNVPETVQLGGPPKFADDPHQTYTQPRKAIDKEHQD